MHLLISIFLISYGFNFLTHYPGAQPTAMGGAYVGIADSKSKILPSQMPQLIISPNPVISNLNIQLSLPKAEKVTLKIFDNSGRIDKKLLNNQLTKGNHRFTYLPEHSGIYFVVAQIGNQNFSEKIISQDNTDCLFLLTFKI